MLFRNRRLARATACYLLLQTVSSLAFPSVSLAMMGPSQPEFTSYEAPGATDMVNLSTGDFSYSLPVLDIPGPERSFSLPLTYKAGIQLEQEASWVGLGWSLNPGAIARSVNGYADDANNEQIENTFKKNIDRGWAGGLPGVLDLGWNSISGHSGAVSLLGLYGYGWDKNGLNNVNLVGISYTPGSGISADPAKMASAALTIATLGVGTPALASNVGASVVTGAIAGMAGGRLGGVAGYNNQPTREVSKHNFYDNYWNYYNNNNTENAYGSLYFGAMSKNVFAGPSSSTSTFDARKGPDVYYTPQATSASKAPLFKYSRVLGATGNATTETAADIYQDDTNEDAISGMTGKYRYLMEGTQYRNVGKRPISIAHDYFSVMGEGVSGAIRPYRLEVGSVAYPKLGVNANSAGEIGHYKHMVVPFLDDYKVGFRYENSLANGYKYHQYTPANGNQDIGLNINASNGSLTITDPSLYANRTEPARKGLHNAFNSASNQTDRQFVQGKHVTWYSNYEILMMYQNSSNGAGNGFLEFEHPAPADDNLAYKNSFRRPLPQTGIGAFAITAEDGTTYHYSLPVYQYRTYTESNEVRTASTIGDLGKSVRRSKKIHFAGDGYTGNPEGTYATSWLLTAITSADYIDRNNSGTVDAADWGGWVKFEYGKFSSRYKWRQPYIGNSYADDTTVINNVGFTEGYKQTYYLNSIATRSHTALFVKSVRQDARGHFRPNILADASNLAIDERYPASSLKLDEIVLLDNATLGKLQTVDGIRTANDPKTVPALSNSVDSQFGPYADGPMNNSGDDMSTVMDTHDLDGDSRIRDYIEANALKRIHFNYGYDLCRGVPNSFQCVSNNPSSLPLMDEANSSTNRGGKLTLRSVSFFGPTINRTPTKITPDFTFNYEKAQQDVGNTNPGYGKEKWDAFGMYSPYGQFNVTSHKPQRGSYPAPWSLTRITTPLGGVTEVEYERDEYAHVSEYGTAKVHLRREYKSSVYNLTYKSAFSGPLTAALKVGQTIYVTGFVKFGYPNSFIAPDFYGYVHLPVQIASISGSQITFTTDFSPTTQSGRPYEIQYADFDAVLTNNFIGGDIRVASLTTKDDNSSYQIRYKYTNPTLSADESSVNSSGVIAKEPPFLDRFYHPIYGAFDYPATPVLYSRVTVLRGLFRNNSDDDYEAREVYSFFTPSTSMISDALPAWQKIGSTSVVVANNQTVVDVGKIAQPQKIEIYNRRGEQELSTSFTYASTVSNTDGIQSQGHYTEGVLNNERLETGTGAVGTSEYRINRSTKEYVPAVMVGSRNTRNGLTTSSTNMLYDFYTGQVLETAFTNSLGKVYHARSVPAYTLQGNEGMGAKGDNPANRHMLAQVGASYTYLEVPGGPTYNPLDFLNPQTSHVLSAGVQTWKKDWNNYREVDANGTYQDVAGQVPVWRQAASYAWQSPALAPDGSLKNFTPFNWTGASDNYWIKTGETVRYDHYSHAVEARDVNGSFAAQKTGYNQTQLIASASNARYTEVAYSGAEDQLTVAGATHFGGEVVAAGGAAVSAPTHTGYYSLQLTSGQKGFVYRVQAGRDVTLGKTYRVSAWANANATSGKLYASLNGSRLAESSLTSATTKKAGAWYLLSLLITVPASANGQTIEFGCANDGTTAANFDDFRVAPLTSTFTSRVYDPRSNRLLYSLDNDNLFTHYEYTPTGRLKRVYQETLDGTGSGSVAEKLVKEYDFNYARFLFPTWLTTAYRCVLEAQGNYTGYEERQVVDVNPLNNPPTATKWESNGACASCTPPPCPYTDSSIPYRLRNNQWEQAQPTSNPVCQSCGMMNGQETSSVTQHWAYANGDDAGNTYSACQPGSCIQ